MPLCKISKIWCDLAPLSANLLIIEKSFRIPYDLLGSSVLRFNEFFLENLAQIHLSIL